MAGSRSRPAARCTRGRRGRQEVQAVRPRRSRCQPLRPGGRRGHARTGLQRRSVRSPGFGAIRDTACRRGSDRSDSGPAAHGPRGHRGTQSACRDGVPIRSALDHAPPESGAGSRAARRGLRRGSDQRGGLHLPRGRVGSEGGPLGSPRRSAGQGPAAGRPSRHVPARACGDSFVEEPRRRREGSRLLRAPERRVPGPSESAGVRRTDRRARRSASGPGCRSGRGCPGSGPGSGCPGSRLSFSRARVACRWRTGR